jgi:hypothetical protein
MKEVDRLFRDLPLGECRNPVTGGLFVNGLDPIAPQKERAFLALYAQRWFDIHGPADAQPLPIFNTAERKRGGGVPHLLAYYTQSLACLDYAVHIHPSFEDYARGMLALPNAPWFFAQDAQLKKRFPPRELRGLNRSTLNWKPPEEQTQTMTSHRRSRTGSAPHSSLTN